MTGSFLKRFSGVNDNLPDETTILNFQHLLEKHELTVVLLEAINAHLKSQGLLVSKGTMIDAALTHMPSSTKNREHARDPEMRQKTKKGKSVRHTSAVDDETETGGIQRLSAAGK